MPKPRRKVEKKEAKQKAILLPEEQFVVDYTVNDANRRALKYSELCFYCRVYCEMKGCRGLNREVTSGL